MGAMENVLQFVSVVTGVRPIDLVSFVVEAIAWRPPEGHSAAKAHVVHHIPGRVRMRIPAKRCNRRYFVEVKDRLERCPSTIGVEVNAASASVLIRYIGVLSGLLAEVTAAGIHELAEVGEERWSGPSRAGRLLERVGRIDERIALPTGGCVNGHSVALIRLLIEAGVQVSSGRLFSAALPLLWYATQPAGGVFPARPGSSNSARCAACPMH